MKVTNIKVLQYPKDTVRLGDNRRPVAWTLCIDAGESMFWMDLEEGLDVARLTAALRIMANRLEEAG